MTRVKNKLQAIFLFILIFHFYIFAQYPLVNQLDPELYIVKAMYYVQTMDISMMNKCVKVWRTLFIIYVCGILIILYEQQWFRPTHSYQWWSRRYITNLRLKRSGERITVVGSSWKSLLLKKAEIRIRSDCIRGKSVWLFSPKKEIIEMRTRLKHAEKVQNQENQNCPNQSQNILSRLSPQKGGVLWTICQKATSSKVKLRGGWSLMWVMRLRWGA